MSNRLLFTTVIMLLLTQNLISQQSGTNDNEFLVKPYLQYSTKNSIKILWETNEKMTSVVLYGEGSKKDIDAPVLTDKKSLDGTRTMHEVELNNLEEETNYFWKVVSKSNSSTIESEVYTFKSVVKDSTAFMFALVGDSQRNNKTPWAWNTISSAVWKERPNFVINAGDLVDWGHNKNEWVSEFLAPSHDLMSRVPMYTVLGNHEGDSDYYYQYMANPSPEYCYTFRYGNAEFFMVDSNRDLSEGSDQYNWLEQQLAKSNATWKIVVHHHPPYSSESDDHGDTFQGQLSEMGHKKVRDLPKLYDKYHVDFCLFGHTHVYERTWPLKDNKINQKEGTIYINSGGAGGGLETFAPTRNWFTLELQEGHHYCTFAIYDTTLIFKAVDHTGVLFDQFQLNKDKDVVSVILPPAPIITSERYMFHEQASVNMDAGLKNLNIKYTIDGSDPTKNSLTYTKPFTVDKSVLIKARAYTSDGKVSRVVSKQFKKVKPLKSKKVTNSKRGLIYKIYEGDWRNKKQEFIKPEHKTKEGLMTVLSLNDLQVDNEFWAIEIDGYFKVEKTDTYTFYGFGSRGVEIAIDGKTIINKEHEQQEVVQLVLQKGYHSIHINSFQRNWRRALGFGYWDEVEGRIPMSPFEISHKE